VADQEQERQAARRHLEEMIGPGPARALAALADQVQGRADPLAALLSRPLEERQRQAVQDLLAAWSRLGPGARERLAAAADPGAGPGPQRRRAAAPQDQREA
jgi:hypothetical protein